MTEKLKTIGIDEREYSIVPGVEIRHMPETFEIHVTRARQGEAHSENWDAPPGTIPSSRPIQLRRRDLDCRVERTKSSTEKGEVRDAFVHEYKTDKYHERCMQQWRHCLRVGSGDTKCCGLNPSFDDTIQRYI